MSEIRSKIPNNEYRDNFDRIFNKDKTNEQRNSTGSGGSSSGDSLPSLRDEIVYFDVDDPRSYNPAKPPATSASSYSCPDTGDPCPSLGACRTCHNWDAGCRD